MLLNYSDATEVLTTTAITYTPTVTRSPGTFFTLSASFFFSLVIIHEIRILLHASEYFCFNVYSVVILLCVLLRCVLLLRYYSAVEQIVHIWKWRFVKPLLLCKTFIYYIMDNFFSC